MNRKRQTIRDPSAESQLFARRAFIAMLVVIGCLTIVVSNLYSLQVTRFSDFQTKSNDNYIKVLPIAPNRGLIYDRNRVLLAENIPIYSLEIIPEEVENLDQTLVQLNKLIPLSEDEIDTFYKTLQGQRRFKPISVKTNLSEQQVAKFSAQKYRFPGVFIDARLSRFYPYADVLTHVIGYVGKINKSDLQKLSESGQDANYAATYDIGKLGIEKYYEERLHGKVGYQQVEVNSQGRIIRILNTTPPSPGTDIVLNIDLSLQNHIANLLENKRGTVIVTDVKTSGILAMYSNPSYDPNEFVHGISSMAYRRLLDSNDKPLINRATQGQYPPASTIKPHLGILGLDAGVITAETSIRDTGRYQLPNVSHVWRDWKRYGHGDVNLRKAIEVSCDIYYYDLAYRLGIDKISDMMSEFGFGEFTGIDLYEESSAILPSRGWKRARFNQPWYVGDTIPVGIGQSYWTATPIQLLQSVNVIINHGERLIPQLLMGDIDPLGAVINEGPKTLRPVVLKKPEYWLTALDAMHAVVAGEEGTARHAFKDANYTSAGKTGTAQLFSVGQTEKYDEKNVAERLKDNAMYVGFAPYENPLISLIVVLENAGGGSANAAPLAKKIMDFYFQQQTMGTHNE